MAVTGLCLQSPGRRRSSSSRTSTSSAGGGNRTWKSSPQRPLVQTGPSAQTSGSSGPGAGKLPSTGSGQAVCRDAGGRPLPAQCSATQTPAVSLWTPLAGWRLASQAGGAPPHPSQHPGLWDRTHTLPSVSHSSLPSTQQEHSQQQPGDNNSSWEREICHETSCSETLKIKIKT